MPRLTGREPRPVPGCSSSTSEAWLDPLIVDRAARRRFLLWLCALGFGLLGVLASRGCGPHLELAAGARVKVVKEVVPGETGSRAYVLVYRTERDCGTVGSEMEAVWAAVRGRAERAGASPVIIVAENDRHASVSSHHSWIKGKGWTDDRRPLGCRF
jgi:hypothetical protein